MLNQIVRYEPVVRLAQQTGGSTLLDVGASSLGLAPWLGPAWDVTAVDSDADLLTRDKLAYQDRSRIVVADAAALPFSDRNFDVVVAIDLLEHVEASNRSDVLSELRRVALRRVVVAAPAGPAALAADQRLARFHQRRSGTVPDWLLEHLENGLPGAEELVPTLRNGDRVSTLGNENVMAHERLMRAEALMRLDSSRPGALVSRALDRLGARGTRDMGRLGVAFSRVIRMLRGRDVVPTYRTIVVVDIAL